MSSPDGKSNEPYRQLEESRGAELNVCARSMSSCHSSLENGTERSMELSSVVVIPDGTLHQCINSICRNTYDGFTYDSLLIAVF